MKKRKILSVFLVVALAMGMLMAVTVMAESKVTLRFTNWFQAEIDRRGLVPLVEEFERMNSGIGGIIFMNQFKIRKVYKTDLSKLDISQ